MRCSGLLVVAAMLAGVPAARAATVSGRAVDANGRVVANATVTVAPVRLDGQVVIHNRGGGRPAIVELEGPTTLTDAAGAFTLEGLAPGWCALTVLPATDSATPALGEPFYFKLESEALDVGTIRLPPSRVRITGRVLLEGEPPSSGGVSHYDPVYGIEGRSTHLESDGGFTLVLPQPTDGVICLRMAASRGETYGRTLRTVEGVAGRTIAVGTFDLAHIRHGSIEGWVMDSKGRFVKSDFLVYAFDPAKPLALEVLPTVTREGLISSALPVGRWRLLFTRPGATPVTRDLTIFSGPTRFDRSREIILVLPDPPRVTISVHLSPTVGGWEPPVSFWDDFTLVGRVVVALRRPDQAGQPLWMLPWAPIRPGGDVALPAPVGDAELELWQVRPGEIAFQAVRRILSAKPGKTNVLRWDVMDTMRSAYLGRLEQAAAYPRQVAAKIEALAGLCAGRSEESHRRLGAELRKLAVEIGSADRKERWQ